jgi:hypothetical protein
MGSSTSWNATVSIGLMTCPDQHPCVAKEYDVHEHQPIIRLHTEAGSSHQSRLVDDHDPNILFGSSFHSKHSRRSRHPTDGGCVRSCPGLAFIGHSDTWDPPTLCRPSYTYARHGTSPRVHCSLLRRGLCRRGSHDPSTGARRPRSSVGGQRRHIYPVHLLREHGVL